MKKTDQERYKYIINGRVVVATSHFAGKKIVGVAKCNPEDTMDVETGKKIASSRLSLKIAKLRERKAKARLKAAKVALANAETELADAVEYNADAQKELEIAEKAANDALLSIQEK